MKRQGLFWLTAGTGAFVFLFLFSATTDHALGGTKNPRAAANVSTGAVSYPSWGGGIPADPEAHARHLEAFGVERSEFEAGVRGWFDGKVAELKTKNNAAITFDLVFNDDLGFQWNWRARARSQADLAAIRDYFTKLDEEDETVVGSIFAERGFERGADGNYVDYRAMRRKDAALLSAWIAAMRAHIQSRRWDARRALEEFLVFCQDIPYVSPKVWENDRYILGFYPAPYLLAENNGDCDMKSVLFGVLWEALYPGSTAFILTPDHMLAAVKGFRKSRGSDVTLRINGEEFLCVEPVGEDRMPAGQIADFSLRAIRAGDIRVIYPLTD